MMRSLGALGVLLLAGCTSAIQQPPQSIIRPRVEILHINGTFEPVTFAVQREKIRVTEGRGPCETNDPMPTGQSLRPLPPMPNGAPKALGQMPNYCPVTVPLAAHTIHNLNTPPVLRKQVPPPTPAEPQP